MNPIRMYRIAPLLLGAALFSAPVWAEIVSATSQCEAGITETTPSSAFTTFETGVIRHEATGLEWRRCAEGMTWVNSSCSGAAQMFTWKDALTHAESQNGWRLPNIKELRSIAERCRLAPAINQQIFPNTLSSNFWSASPYVEYSDRAWYMDFTDGSVSWKYKSNDFMVRLVRGGQ